MTDGTASCSSTVAAATCTLTLTGAGVTLQEQARKIVNAARDFKMTAEGLRGTVTGELVFGLNNRPENCAAWR